MLFLKLKYLNVWCGETFNSVRDANIFISFTLSVSLAVRFRFWTKVVKTKRNVKQTVMMHLHDTSMSF